MLAPAIQTQLRIAALFEAREDAARAAQDDADEAFEAAVDRCWAQVEASDVLAEMCEDAKALASLTDDMRGRHTNGDMLTRAIRCAWDDAHQRVAERLARASLANEG